MSKTYIPKSGRQCANKKYYVFFNINSEYAGKYAIVYASNSNKAYLTALERFGHMNVASVNPNEEYSLNKIKLYELEEV